MSHICIWNGCQQSFGTEEDVFNHLVLSHWSGSRKTPMVCMCIEENDLICEKSLSTKADFKDHNIRHFSKSLRPFKCPTCNLAHRSRVGLRKHQKIHFEHQLSSVGSESTPSHISDNGNIETIVSNESSNSVSQISNEFDFSNPITDFILKKIESPLLSMLQLGEETLEEDNELENTIQIFERLTTRESRDPFLNKMNQIKFIENEYIKIPIYQRLFPDSNSGALWWYAFQDIFMTRHIVGFSKAAVPTDLLAYILKCKERNSCVPMNILAEVELWSGRQLQTSENFASFAELRYHWFKMMYSKQYIEVGKAFEGMIMKLRMKLIELHQAETIFSVQLPVVFKCTSNEVFQLDSFDKIFERVLYQGNTFQKVILLFFKFQSWYYVQIMKDFMKFELIEHPNSILDCTGGVYGLKLTLPLASPLSIYLRKSNYFIVFKLISELSKIDEIIKEKCFGDDTVMLSQFCCGGVKCLHMVKDVLGGDLLVQKPVYVNWFLENVNDYFSRTFVWWFKIGYDKDWVNSL